MRILIVEDEMPAYQRLVKLLKEVLPEVTIAAHFDTIKETELWLTQNPKIDLAFFDIHLADGSIFDLLKNYHPAFPIVFITAYDEFALEAFKTNSLSYLLKPIDKINLEAALKKNNALKEWFGGNMPAVTKSNAAKKRFIIRFGEHLKTLHTEDIAYCCSENKMTFARTFQGQKLPMDNNLDSLEGLLPKENFFRINRQYIINLNAIAEMKIYTKGRVMVSLKPELTEAQIVSSERSADFKLWLAGELDT
ncbi:MAG: LytTR family DNA-binding domain-containing protein [Bacteroidota bacterium]